MTIAFFTLYLALFLLPAVVVAAYHMLLMVAKLAGACGHADEGTQPTHTFAIVIPAHNEEEIIARVLKSCAELDYPADKYRVFVIADNCTDRTAALSRSLHASCLERQDAERAGKGHAWSGDLATSCLCHMTPSSFWMPTASSSDTPCAPSINA